MDFDHPLNDIQKARMSRELKSVPNFINSLSDQSLDLLHVVKRQLDVAELNLTRRDVTAIHDGQADALLNLKQRSAAMMMMLAVALKSVDDLDLLVEQAEHEMPLSKMTVDLANFKEESLSFAEKIKTSLQGGSGEISKAIQDTQNQTIPDFIKRIRFYYNRIANEAELHGPTVANLFKF